MHILPVFIYLFFLQKGCGIAVDTFKGGAIVYGDIKRRCNMKNALKDQERLRKIEEVLLGDKKGIKGMGVWEEANKTEGDGQKETEVKGLWEEMMHKERCI